jgi:hypothetical protein
MIRRSFFKALSTLAALPVVGKLLPEAKPQRLFVGLWEFPQHNTGHIDLANQPDGWVSLGWTDIDTGEFTETWSGPVSEWKRLRKDA